MPVTETFTVSPVSARFAVFETVTMSGDSAFAGDEIAQLATSAVAVALSTSVLIDLFMISRFFSFDLDLEVITS